MATKNKPIKNIRPDNFNELLAISGNIYPRNDYELEQFELLYQGFDFKLRDFRVNPDEIVSNSFNKNGTIVRIFENDEQNDIDELKIAARKGINQISKSILDKMKRKHNNDNK